MNIPVDEMVSFLEAKEVQRVISMQIQEDNRPRFSVDTDNSTYLVFPFKSGDDIKWRVEHLFDGTLEDCYKFIKEDYEDSIGS